MLTEGQRRVGRWGGEWTASRIWVCLVEQVQADRDGEDWGQDDEASCMCVCNRGPVDAKGRLCMA
jgi:hypothetical protein